MKATSNKICLGIIIVLTILIAFSVSSVAEQNRKVDLMVVAGWITQPIYQMEEKFWTETVPEALKDTVEVNTTMTSLDQIGVKGAAVIRQMEDGIFDVVSTVSDYVVSDYPELTGLDLPCIAYNIDLFKDIAEVYRPVLEEYAENNFYAKVIAMTTYPGQYLFLRKPIEKLQDLKGMKIRGSGWSTIKFVEALNATGVNISFAEVTQALQRGIVDGGVTGSLSGYNAKWGEVTSYIYPLPLGGWDPLITYMNIDTWNKFTPEEQEVILKLAREKFEPEVWKYSAQATQEGIDHLTGTKKEGEEYAYGEPNDLTLIEVKPEDIELAKQILMEKVLPEWAQMISEEAIDKWNKSIGKVVDITIEK